MKNNTAIVVLAVAWLAALVTFVVTGHEDIAGMFVFFSVLIVGFVLI